MIKVKTQNFLMEKMEVTTTIIILHGGKDAIGIAKLNMDGNATITNQTIVNRFVEMEELHSAILLSLNYGQSNFVMMEIWTIWMVAMTNANKNMGTIVKLIQKQILM